MRAVLRLNIKIASILRLVVVPAQVRNVSCDQQQCNTKVIVKRFHLNGLV